MRKRPTQPPTLTETLRAAVNESPLSFQALERETGVKRQVLMKFAREESGMRLETADRLAVYFKLKLVAST
ncbi:hypothetical protein KOR34_19640 [Posidoniimonas corsicana]|uniref:HTH cro/C1-type domain-containing protein n=1 Tax=Posidoniimonas corsicana TaxID=1938618 RepID=A0A5C5VEG7_9BACT|nr:hypothetical protein [Posidoniimonas corsicana]TWT37018.1 hypothetical protein KOR34_19640 [Posidoniimonas corsicana]